MPRRFRIAALAGALAALCFVVAPAGTPRAAAQELGQPKADIVVDATTGKVLIGDNVHESLHPASTSKIMTALVATERLAPHSVVPAAPNTAAIPTNKIGFGQDARWPLDQMMAALMMTSANDAAYALANAAGGGSLDRFAAQATETGKRLGMKESTFNDPSGLDDESSFKGGPYMSAYDLAIATRNALAVPDIAKWAALREYSFVDPQGIEHNLLNHNKTLPGGPFAYDGMTGFKTGFTSRAGHTFVGTATRNGRTLIAVILGVPTSGYAEATSLLDAGFAMAPNAPAAGEPLPAVAVSPYADRAGDLAAFRALGAPTKTAGNATVASSVPVFDSPPPAPVTAAQTATAGASASGPTASTSDSGGGGFFQLRYFVLVVVLLLTTAVVLRRRKVKRQRALRLARQRQRAAAMRSGGLPVVDGRYRTGTRVGPPVESHVRIQPVADHGSRHRGTG